MCDSMGFGGIPLHWFYEDIIEEVKNSKNLNVSFHHIANSEVDCLVKEGVLRPSLLISSDC